MQLHPAARDLAGMTGGAPARRRPRLVLGAAVLAAALVAAVLLHRPAPGVQLDGSDPADNARLGAVPGTVTLQFSGAAPLALAHVVIEDARGATVSRGDAEVSGSQVRQPLTANGDGLFQIGYHVVSSDGAESSGVLRFTVGAAPASGPAAPAPDAGAGHVHLTKDPLSLLLVLVDLILVVVLVVAMLGRRRPVGR